MSDFMIGKTINGMKIAEDKKALLFVADDGDHIVKVDGECCSSTWIETVELPALGFPAKVLSVENLDMPDLGSPDEYTDVIAYYGCKVTTDKGEIIIDYRNESNGYYGGDISWPDSYHYGGVYGQNVSNEKWTYIKQ